MILVRGPRRNDFVGVIQRILDGNCFQTLTDFSFSMGFGKIKEKNYVPLTKKFSIKQNKEEDFIVSPKIFLLVKGEYYNLWEYISCSENSVWYHIYFLFSIFVFFYIVFNFFKIEKKYYIWIISFSTVVFAKFINFSLHNFFLSISTLRILFWTK